MNKSYLLYGKSTWTLIIIELVISIILVIVGIVWMFFTNVFVLLLMILTASFFFVDFLKKIKYKLTLTDTTIIVENDELPLNKKIQYYNKTEYKDITNIYIEADDFNSKGEKIKEYLYHRNKKIIYLTLECNKKKNRIFISYLKDDELEEIIDNIINNINKISSKQISISGRDIIDDFIN